MRKVDEGFEKSQADADELLDTLTEQLGDDWRLDRTIDLYNKLIEDNTPLAYTIGTRFLRWASLFPDRIGLEDAQACSCIDGWVETPNGYRACGRCRREVYTPEESL